jgi:hypothetical protein
MQHHGHCKSAIPTFYGQKERSSSAGQSCVLIRPATLCGCISAATVHQRASKLTRSLPHRLPRHFRRHHSARIRPSHLYVSPLRSLADIAMPRLATISNRQHLWECVASQWRTGTRRPICGPWACQSIGDIVYHDRPHPLLHLLPSRLPQDRKSERSFKKP